MVFITVAGVVTHKVPFTATSDYNGEYSFNIHGLVTMLYNIFVRDLRIFVLS